MVLQQGSGTPRSSRAAGSPQPQNQPARTAQAAAAAVEMKPGHAGRVERGPRCGLISSRYQRVISPQIAGHEWPKRIFPLANRDRLSCLFTGVRQNIDDHCPVVNDKSYAQARSSNHWPRTQPARDDFFGGLKPRPSIALPLALALRGAQLARRI